MFCLRYRLPGYLLAFAAYVGSKQRREVAADLKTIYSAATEAEAEQRLAEFSLKWDAKFPTIAKIASPASERDPSDRTSGASR